MKNNIREQVIESAAQIFAENEFADVSLEHITAIARGNNAERVKLFSSEDKIYEAVLEY